MTIKTRLEKLEKGSEKKEQVLIIIYDKNGGGTVNGKPFTAAELETLKKQSSGCVRVFLPDNGRG